MENLGIEGTVSVITGGSEGIGYGIAEALYSRGSKIYLIARNREKLEKAREKLQSGDSRVEIYQGDITNFSRIKEIIDEVHKKEKKIDIFVNNAGAYEPHSVRSSFAKIKDIWNLLFVSPSEITHYLVQKFRDSPNRLKILNVLSQASKKFMDEGLGYGTGKMAFDSYLEHMELELSRNKINNIKIYRLYPATVGTEKGLELVRRGVLQNPIPLEDVVRSAINLLEDKIKGNKVYVGFTP